MSARHLAATALAALAVSFVAPAASATDPLARTPLCFTVHNPGGPVVPGGPSLPADPAPQAVAAHRFTSTHSDPARILLLVHGHSWWSNEWDLKPDFSIARNLARQGFVVITYDRLGNGASPYEGPARTTLTFSGQRSMLHEVVEQVRGHSVRRAGEPDPCLGSPPQPAPQGLRVGLVGHSQGAILVNGYPAAYGPADPGHVDALLEDGNGACAAGAACPLPGLGVRATAIVTRKLAADVGRDFSLGLTDGSYDPSLSWQPKVKTVDPVTCVDDTFGMLWPEATADQALVDEPCRAANEETVPYQEFVSISALADDLPRTDAHLPVLLVFAEHDGLRPDKGNPDDATCNPDPMHDVGCRQPFVEQWRDLCPCRAHVTSWVLRDSGHSIALARSMPRYTEEVGAWLRANGMAPHPR